MHKIKNLLACWIFRKRGHICRTFVPTPHMIALIFPRAYIDCGAVAFYPSQNALSFITQNGMRESNSQKTSNSDFISIFPRGGISISFAYISLSLLLSLGISRFRIVYFMVQPCWRGAVRVCLVFTDRSLCKQSTGQ